MTSVGAAPPGAPRVLVVTDSDSYVKYGAALLGTLPEHWDGRMVVVRGNALPNRRQLTEAVFGSGIAPDDIDVVDRRTLRRSLRDGTVDVVVVAARGMTAEPVVRWVAKVPNRPILVTALPGVSIPPLAPGLRLRQGVDVFVVHSNRELRESIELAAAAGFGHRFELGSLPFLSADPADVERDRIVFASQAVIPAEESERSWLLDVLIETARRHPDLKVVIKLRAYTGEAQTHVERFAFEDLLAQRHSAGEPIPPNLFVDVGPMAGHLQRAVGCVTVSSTAVLEAVAMGVPSLVLSDFGVGPSQINEVFVDSGLIGTTDDLLAARFYDPDPSWLSDNYLHARGANTWTDAVEELLVARRSGTLGPAHPPTPANPARFIRRAIYERLAFGASGRAVLNRLYIKSAFWHGHRRWRTRR